jgi:acyl-CoA synthetase (AMP-forming)/AMP-acid ligase II
MMKNAMLIGSVTKHMAELYGDKIAFISRGNTVSFWQFNRRVNRLCNALGDLGLRKGDTVAFLSRNRVECIEVYCVGKAGLVGMPLNWRLVPAELILLLKDSGTTTIVADEYHAQVVDSLRGELPNLVNFIAMDTPRAGWLSYEDMLAGASESEPAILVDPEDPLCLFYTSGTTGLPKGVVLTHGGLIQNASEMASLVLLLTPQDLAVTVMPLFHVGGMWYHLFANYLSGCTNVIEEAFEPARTLSALKKYHATNIHLVPTMIGALLNLPGVESESPDHLRLMFYAASSMPEDILRRAMAVFRHSAFIQSYGSTEGGVCTALTAQDHLDAMQVSGRQMLLGSCGRAIGATGLKIIDSDGLEMPRGEIGEIAVRSTKIMKGYWNNPKADRDAITDGWFRMGDLAFQDRDGYVFIVGRKHDMIVTGGENVFPHEVENVLFTHPKISEAAVYGVPDPKWVEAVAAAVILKEGCEADAAGIIAFCKERLAGYKCPKVVFFTDSLPKSPAGKILKRKLRETCGTK